MLLNTIPLLFALLFIPYYFLQVVQHEGAHALVLTLLGGKLVEFYPFPKWKDRWFPDTLGNVEYVFSEAVTAKDRALIAIAPLMLNFLIVGLGISIESFVPVGTVLYTILTLVVCWNIIDAAYNMMISFEDSAPYADSDIWEWINNTGANPRYVRVFSILWAAIHFFILF